MAHERLTNCSILSIEEKVAKSIDFDDIVTEFVLLKARKALL